MKLHFLALLFMAMAFLLFVQVQSGPVELLTSTTNLASTASISSALPNSELWGGKTTFNNNTSPQIAHEVAPPQSATQDNHPKLKVVLLAIVFILIVLALTVCYCCWKHKATIAKAAVML
jgi:hypothetical protein